MSVPTTEVLNKTFRACFGVAERHIGNSATVELFQNSYRRILEYFPNLDKFHIGSDFQLHFGAESPDDNHILAFAVWMRKYNDDFQQLMIGHSPIQIDILTKEISSDLESIGFYEFYQQASELNYK